MQTLLPELIDAVSEHIPLTWKPQTLLSLSLTCRRVNTIVIPHLLYRHVRIEGEELCRAAITRMSVEQENTDRPPLGHYVQNLIISTPRTSTAEVDVLAQFHISISNGVFPQLRSLAIILEGGWQWDGESGEELEFHQLDPPFWKCLETRCPHLSELVLVGLIGQGDDPETVSTAACSQLKLHHISIESAAIDMTGLMRRLGDPIIRDNLQALELASPGDIVIDEKLSLLDMTFPRLSSFILEAGGCDLDTVEFFERHPLLTRVEIGIYMGDSWFVGFHGGLLPNLKVLKCTFVNARSVLPHIGHQLTTLDLLETSNSQAVWLLRTRVSGGILPRLRSLGIQLRASTNSKNKAENGHGWREDERGHPSQESRKKFQRYFDGNYVMSVAKAAPNLEELELMGPSCDRLDAISSSLSLMPKLRHLSISGPQNYTQKPFFEVSRLWVEDDPKQRDLIVDTYDPAPLYTPDNFERVALDLANGCRTLGTISLSSRVAEWLADDKTARIIRNEEGTVDTIVMSK
ncbi:hypothetical protein PUNSTDRAFT_125934, partial [Punctularia strigosozonata HHB-11173 SS5]|uniref:uncharacterized protein n=1 Tax=Punctularia strigosozonata (strain HHB-11173) TaxID=741275 RepID=UPI000441751D